MEFQNKILMKIEKGWFIVEFQVKDKKQKGQDLSAKKGVAYKN
ncbi:MAG: hypothetical protein WCT42_03240 [Candidatus Paceibacterota bacterium]